MAPNIKIFNFGLPRTGTTSFHNFLLNNNVKSLHSNGDEIDQIYPIEYFNYLNNKPSIIDNYIDQYSAFSDCPWYSLAKKIVCNYHQNPNVYFVATFRSDHNWSRSFLTIKHECFKTTKNSQYHKFIYKKVLKTTDHKKLHNFYFRFYNNLELIAKKYNSKITKLDLSDTTKIVEIMEKIIPVFNTEYPHDNSSQ